MNPNVNATLFVDVGGHGEIIGTIHSRAGEALEAEHVIVIGGSTPRVARR
jgi:hypothetical protein